MNSANVDPLDPPVPLVTEVKLEQPVQLDPVATVDPVDRVDLMEPPVNRAHPVKLDLLDQGYVFLCYCRLTII